MKRPPYDPRRDSAHNLIKRRLKRFDDLRAKFLRHLRMEPNDREGAAQLMVQLQRARESVPQSHWLRVDAVRFQRSITQ